MTLPTLPTDNLYKFLSIFGLILFVFSVYMYNDTQNKIYLKVDDYNIKNEIFESNIKKHASTSLSENLIAEKIRLRIIREQINREIGNLPEQYRFYVVICFLGVSMIGFGFYFWYSKTQSFNDLILKNESENLRNNKEISIHKLQFEKEFLIYNELWKSLIELRACAVLLRPEGEIIDSVETDEERKYSKIKKINLVFNNCVNIYENNKPFYPKDVYDEISKTIVLAKKEVIEYKSGKSYTDDYWDNAERNINEIISSIDLVCEKIRVRIGLIKVVN